MSTCPSASGVLGAAGTRVQVRIGCGEPAEQVVSVAGRERADLVLLLRP